MKENRVLFLDWLRVIACFMVMTIHSVEPFYLGGGYRRMVRPVSEASYGMYILHMFILDPRHRQMDLLNVAEIAWYRS